MHIACRLEDDGERREDDLELVRAKIGQQAAHQAPVVDLADDVVVLRGLLGGLLLRVLRFSVVCHTLFYFRWFMAWVGFWKADDAMVLFA